MLTNVLLKSAEWTASGLCKEFLVGKGEYFTGKLSDKAFESEYGFIMFPFSGAIRLTTNTEYFVTVTNPELAKAILVHNPARQSSAPEEGSSSSASETNDPHARYNFRRINNFFRTEGDQAVLLTQQGEAAKAGRQGIVSVIESHQNEMNTALASNLQRWCSEAISAPAPPNLEISLQGIVTRVIAKHLLGLDVLPDDFDKVVKLINDFDRAMMSMDVTTMFAVESQLYQYSEELFENNSGNITNTDYMLPHLINGVNNQNNIAMSFLLTANLSRLIILSIIKLATDNGLQLQYKNALKILQDDPENGEAKQTLNNFYKEFCRLYGGMSFISRYSSIPISFNVTGAGGENFEFNFPANSFFQIPSRRLRLSNVFGEDSLEFNPERYFNEAVPNPLVGAYSPFGAGARQCPALSHNFIKNTVEQALAIFLTHTLTVGTSMEEIPAETTYIELLHGPYCATVTNDLFEDVPCYRPSAREVPVHAEQEILIDISHLQMDNSGLRPGKNRI